MKRQNGSGTLIKTSTGLYIAKWNFQGQTFTRSTKTYNRDEALQKLDEFVKPYLEKNEIAVIENLEAKVRTLKQTQTVERIELKNIVNIYSSKCNISPQTKYLHRSIINIFLKWMYSNYPNVVYIDEITRSHVEKFFNTRLGGYTDIAFNNYLSVMRKVMNCLHVKNNIFQDFEKRKVLEVDRRLFTNDEIETILNSCIKQHEKILFYTAVYTGMRRSDICTLKWKNISFDSNVIVKVSIKTNKKFIVPIHKRLLELLKTLPVGNPEEYVSDELYVLYKKNQKSISQLIKCVYRRSGVNMTGLKKGGLHIFRRLFCTKCANNGITLPVLMKFLGHTQPTTTLKYYNNFNTLEMQEKLSAVL